MLGQQDTESGSERVPGATTQTAIGALVRTLSRRALVDHFRGPLDLRTTASGNSDAVDGCDETIEAPQGGSA